MNPKLKSVVGVVAGMLVGGVLALLVERIGHAVYPPPPGLDPGNVEQLREMMSGAPPEALLFVLAAWIVAPLSGAWVAARIAGRNRLLHGLVVGVLFLGAGIFTLVSIPHPVWFNVIGVLVFLPSAFAGARLAG